MPQLGALLVGHGAAELAEVVLSELDLPDLLLLAPLEVLRHQLRHARDGLLGGLGVDVREAHAQREEVLDRAAVLADSVLHLRLDEGEAGHEKVAEARPAAACIEERGEW